MKIFKKIILTVLLFQLIGCGKDDDGMIRDSVFVVGYDPCTVAASGYRIAYLLISEDLRDTLVTYNLSDMTGKLPASVLLEPNDTLYKIPDGYFQNYRNSIYFPESARFEFKLDIGYRYAKESEMTFNLCKHDIPSFTAPQVIVETATK